LGGATLGGGSRGLRHSRHARSQYVLRPGDGRDQENAENAEARSHCGPSILRSGGLGGGASDWPGSTLYTVVRPVATKQRLAARCRSWGVTRLRSSRAVNSLRQSPWLKIIGEDFLLKACQFAHEADPNSQLYYNDFSLENAPKRAGAIALIKKLQAQGAPLAGIGLQGHYRMEWPAPRDVDETIEAFARLGLKVMITELDVSVLPAVTRTLDAEVSQNYQLRAEDNPYTNGLPDTMQQALAARYAGLFKVFVKHRDQITRVTFWGVTDGNSWLNYWPVRGRIDYPMLFARGCGTKPAFDAVVAAGRGKGQ